MKEKTTYVDGALFEAIIRKHGIEPVAQAGFIKVRGPQGYALYVARTKRVGRVDLSWGKDQAMAGPGFRKPSDGAFGNVHQQMDFSLTQDEILANFERALTTMQKFPAVERKARAPKLGGAKAPEAKGWSAGIKVETRADRKALIEAEAKRRGLSVSPKTVAEIKAAGDKRPAPAAGPVRAAADKA